MKSQTTYFALEPQRSQSKFKQQFQDPRLQHAERFAIKKSIQKGQELIVLNTKGLSKEARQQIKQNKIDPPQEQKRMIIEKDIEVMKLEDNLKHVQQDQLSNILNMYSKDNDHRIQKKRKKMLQLIKKLKEEKKDQKEQIDLLDSKMRLYYLIREYAKETQGVEQIDQYTEEVFDLGFFDQIKAKQQQRSVNIRDRYLRRKLLIKQNPGDGDLAEANSDDSEFLDEDLEEKILYGLGQKNRDTSKPENQNNLPLIRELYQKQKNIELEQDAQKFQTLLQKNGKQSSMQLRFQNPPQKNNQKTNSSLKCKFCQDNDRGLKNVKGRCLCDKKQKDHDRAQLQDAMRKKVFGLDDLKRMNTKTLEYLDQQMKTQSIQKQNYELSLKKRKYQNSGKPPLTKQQTRISDARTDFTNTLQPLKSKALQQDQNKLSPRLAIEKRNSARRTNNSQSPNEQKGQKVLPQMHTRPELKKRQANEIQTQTNDSLLMNRDKSFGFKGLQNKVDSDVINEIKRQVKEELKFELKNKEILEDESEYTSQYKSSPIRNQATKPSVRLSPLRLEKPIQQTPIPISNDYRKPPLPLSQNHNRAYSQNQLDFKSSILKLQPLSTNQDQKIRPFSFGEQNPNYQRRNSLAPSTQVNTNSNIILKESASSRLPFPRSHFRTIINSIPDEGELKLDSNDEPIESRNINEEIKQVTISVLSNNMTEEDKIQDYKDRGYLNEEEKINELKLPDESPSKKQSPIISPSLSPQNEKNQFRQSRVSYDGNSVFKRSMQYWHNEVKPTKLPKVSAKKHLELELMDQKNIGTVVLRLQRFHLSDLV